MQRYNHLFKIQMFFNKILLFIFSVLVFCVHIGYAQAIDMQLEVGDKSFEQKKYQESFKVYDDILANKQNRRK